MGGGQKAKAPNTATRRAKSIAPGFVLLPSRRPRFFFEVSLLQYFIRQHKEQSVIVSSRANNPHSRQGFTTRKQTNQGAQRKARTNQAQQSISVRRRTKKRNGEKNAGPLCGKEAGRQTSNKRIQSSPAQDIDRHGP